MLGHNPQSPIIIPIDPARVSYRLFRGSITHEMWDKEALQRRLQERPLQKESFGFSSLLHGGDAVLTLSLLEDGSTWIRCDNLNIDVHLPHYEVIGDDAYFHPWELGRGLPSGWYEHCTLYLAAPSDAFVGRWWGRWNRRVLTELRTRLRNGHEVNDDIFEDEGDITLDDLCFGQALAITCNSKTVAEFILTEDIKIIEDRSDETDGIVCAHSQYLSRADIEIQLESDSNYRLPQELRISDASLEIKSYRGHDLQTMGYTLSFNEDTITTGECCLHWGNPQQSETDFYILKDGTVTRHDPDYFAGLSDQDFSELMDWLDGCE